MVYVWAALIPFNSYHWYKDLISCHTYINERNKPYILIDLENFVCFLMFGILLAPTGFVMIPNWPVIFKNIHIFPIRIPCNRGRNMTEDQKYYEMHEKLENPDL